MKDYLAQSSGELAQGAGVSKRDQVADQCKAVAHMCAALIGVHNDYENIFRGAHVDELIDIVGNRTAALMEHLGNVIDGMDAGDAADEWINPVFERAHAMFPQEPGKDAAATPKAE